MDEDAVRDDYWSKARRRLPDKTEARLQSILNPTQPRNIQGDAAIAETEPEPTQVFWPDRLRKSCENRKKEYEDAQWKVSFGEKKLSLHSLWDKAIEALSKLKDLGTAATSAQPMASLGWSIAQALIQIPVEKEKVARSVVEGLSKVIIIMSRGYVYERQLNNAWNSEDRDNMSTLEDFLVDLYERTLRFLIAAFDHYSKGVAHRTWIAVWSSDRIADFDKDTTQIQCDLQQEVATRFRLGAQGDLHTLLESQKTLQAQLWTLRDGIGTGIDALLRGQTEILSEQERNRLAIIDKQKKKERLAVLRWLSKFPHIDHHKFAKANRTPDTGDWVFEKYEYQGWDESRSENILWIHGIPGAGKTKLITKIVDHTDIRVCDDDDVINHAYKNKSVAFFYCRRDDVSRRNSANILCSLTKQLLHRCDVLPAKVVELFERKSPDDAASQELDVNDCGSMLRDAIDCHDDVLLVLDALDECDPSAREDLLSVIKKVTQAGRSSSKVKVVLSSRELPEITKQLDHEQHFRISVDDNKGDIDRFVEDRLDREGILKVPLDLQAKIKTTFSKKSQTMFQWAAVHLEYILRLPTADDIEDALARPPKDLEQAYENTFETIKSDPAWGPYVIRACAWLQTHGGSSLSTLLVAAASQKPERTGDFQTALVDADDLLKASQFLLVTEDEYVRFSHLSVQEHFERHENEQVSHFVPLFLLKALLYYDPENVPVDPQTKVPFPELVEFYKDACESWWLYIRPYKDRKDVNLLLQMFLGPKPPTPGCRRWLVHLANRVMQKYFSDPVKEDIERQAASYIFSPSAWLEPPTEHIQRYRAGSSVSSRIRRKESRSRLDSYKYESEDARQLLTTFVTGCFIKVKETLATSANPDDWMSLELDPIVWDLEIRNNDDCDANDSSDSTHEELQSRHVPSVEQQQTSFLRDFPKFKESDSVFWFLWLIIIFIIELAPWTFHLRSRSRALLEMSQHIEPEGHQGLDSMESSIDVQDIPPLRDTFINLVKALGFFSQPTRFISDEMIAFFLNPQKSLSKCYEEIARATLICLCQSTYWYPEQTILIEKLFDLYDLSRPLQYDYVDVSLLDRSPLLVAPQSGSWSLKSKDIVMRRNTHYQPRLIRFLVLDGADVNFEATSGKGPGTPLIAAFMQYDEIGSEVADFLLEKHADVNQRAREGPYGTALIAACARGPVSGVERLIKHEGIHINAVASVGNYGTALIAACAENQVDIVKILLRHDAKSNLIIRSGKYQTAWLAALQAGNARIVMHLINKDTELDGFTLRDLPSTMEEARKRWDFFRSPVYTPITETYDGEGDDQCTMAAKQISIALIYTQLDKDMDWADEYKKKAMACLTFFSSHREDFRAAQTIARCFGFTNPTKNSLRAWLQVLISTRVEESHWPNVASSLLGLIYNIDEDPNPSVQRVATWGSSSQGDIFQDSDPDDSPWSDA